MLAHHSIDIRLPALCRSGGPALLGLLGAAPDEPSGPASTLGWDTVFAIRIADVNAALRRPGVCPDSFQHTVEEGYAIGAELGPWRIVSGGAGTNLHVEVPIVQGTLHFQEHEHDIAGCAARIELRLRYLADADAAPTSGAAAPHRLVVESNAASAGADAVSVLELRESGAPLAPVARALAIGALSECFNANLDAIRHVFCTVRLGAPLGEDTFPWLAPAGAGYAVADAGADADPVFGVLCHTGRADASDGRREAPWQLSPHAIPTGARAAFLIAPDLILREMILPAMPFLFPGVGREDFALETGRAAATAKRELRLDPVIHEGQSYVPFAERLEIELVGRELRIHSRIRTEVSAGIDAFVAATHTLELELAEGPDGRATLCFVQAGEPSIETWQRLAPGIELLQFLLPIIAAVAALIALVVSGGTAAFAVGLTFGLAAGAAHLVPELIASARSGAAEAALPSPESLVLAATEAVQWPDAQGFSLTHAGLNVSLQLGGDPHFPELEG